MPTTLQLPEKEPKGFHAEPLEFEVISRAAADGAAEADKEPEIWAVLSSETPCVTYFGTEVLSHEKSAVDMSLARHGISMHVEHGGLPYRVQPDPAMHVGHVEPIELRPDRKLWGRLNFSDHELAQRMKRSILDRTWKFVSIYGQRVRRKVLRAPEKIGDPREDLVTRWRPEELGLVSIPADPNAQAIARAASLEAFPVEYEFESPTVTQEEPKMPDPVTTTAAPAAAPAAPAAAPAEPAAGAVTRSAGGSAVSVQEPPATPDEVMALCDAQKFPISRGREFLQKGYSVAQIKSALFDEMSARSAGSGSMRQPASEMRVPGMPAKDRRRYSVTRALLQAIRAREGSGKFDGIEGEWSAELANAAPVARGGYWIPLEQETPEEKLERADLISRAMGTGVVGGGAELVFDQPQAMLDVLRNLMLTGRFGAQTITGLNGNVPYPVQTGDPTAYFVGENRTGGVTQSQLAWVNRTLSAKETAAQSVFSRRLLETAGFNVEMMVRRSLLAKHALLWDATGLFGSGTDGQPAGVWNCPGVGTVAMGGAITFPKVVDLETGIVDANVIAEEMAYITTPPVRGKAKQTLVASASGSSMIWTGGGAVGEMNGYKAGATKQVSRTLGGGANEHGILFGWWNALIYGFWGALNFMVDDSSAAVAGNGQVVITTNQLGDCLVSRPEAFAIGTGLTA